MSCNCAQSPCCNGQANTLILSPDCSDAGGIRATSETNTYVSTNLLDRDLGKVWRSTSTACGVSIILDMGSQTQVDYLSLVGTNLTCEAQIRVRGATKPWGVDNPLLLEQPTFLGPLGDLDGWAFDAVNPLYEEEDIEPEPQEPLVMGCYSYRQLFQAHPFDCAPNPLIDGVDGYVEPVACTSDGCLGTVEYYDSGTIDALCCDDVACLGDFPKKDISHLIPQCGGVTLRYWRIDIYDPSNPDGYIQAARFMAGKSLQVKCGTSGDAFSFDSSAQTQRSRSGRLHTSCGSVTRRFDGSFPLMCEDEYKQWFRQSFVGGLGQDFFISASPVDRCLDPYHSFYGKLESLPSFDSVACGKYGSAFTFIENPA